jgi:hypothetical protein
MAQLVPTVATPITVPGLYAALQTAWSAQMGAPAPRGALLCLLAQWALETGRGRYCYCYNLGNVRHVDGDGRDWCQLPKVNEVIDGVTKWYYPPDPMTNFRAFESLDAGAADYLATLRTNFARVWPSIIDGEPHAFVKALAAAHYFTASEAQYEATLCAIFTELDREVPPEVAQPAGIAVSLVAPHVGPESEPPEGVS